MQRNRLEVLYRGAGVKPPSLINITGVIGEQIRTVNNFLAEMRKRRDKGKIEAILTCFKAFNQELAKNRVDMQVIFKKKEEEKEDLEKRLLVRLLGETIVLTAESIETCYPNSEEFPCKRFELSVVVEGLALLKYLLLTCKLHRLGLHKLDGLLVFCLKAAREAQLVVERDLEKKASHGLEKSILSLAMSISCNLVKLWDGILPKECLSHIEGLLTISKSSTFPKLIRFAETLCGEEAEQKLFQQLTSRVLTIQEDKSFVLEAALTKSKKFIKKLVTCMVSFIHTIKDLSSVKTSEEYCDKITTYIREKSLCKAGIDLSKNFLTQEPYIHIRIYEVQKFNIPENIINYYIGESVFSQSIVLINALMVGRRKTFFKDYLQWLQFEGGVLQKTFDFFFREDIEKKSQLEWTNDQPESNAYFSNIESIRIQYLRMCTSWLDGDPTIKRSNMFISSQDKEILLQRISPFCKKKLEIDDLEKYCFEYNRKVKPVEEVLDASLLTSTLPYFTQRDQEKPELPFDKIQAPGSGLIVKLINHLLANPKNSSCSYWICTLFETFTRGVNPFIQVFFTVSGLTCHLIDRLIEDKSMNKNTMQIYFDLLGELVKYSVFNLTLLTSMISRKGSTSEFYQLLTKSIVDSNVLIRTCLLTDFFIQTVCGLTSLEEEGNILNLLNVDMSRLYKRLIEAVTPQNMSFESSFL
jgi:hypothetical protein